MAYIQPHPAWRVEFSISRDAERSVQATDPWSLLRNSDRWRRNPLIDDGHYFNTGLQVDFDTRNDRDRPTSGWLIRGRLRALDQRRYRPSGAAPRRPTQPPDRGRICHRPDLARSPPLCATDTGSSSERKDTGRRVDRG